MVLWLAGWLVAPASGAEHRVDCSEVISATNRQVRMLHGGAADMDQVAKKLGTSVAWVERCMIIYGRRPKRPGYESPGSRQAEIEKWESEEPEEEFPEDKEEPGARERLIIPDKPRRLRLKLPTPTEFGDDFFEESRKRRRQLDE